MYRARVMLRRCLMGAVLLLMTSYEAYALGENRVYIRPGELSLSVGQSRILGSRTLAMQNDGNLVLKDTAGKIVWSTGLTTPCTDCVASYDKAGVLSVRSSATNRQLFSSNTGSELLVLQDDYPFMALYKFKPGVDGFPVPRLMWEPGVERVGEKVRQGLRPLVLLPSAMPKGYDYVVQDVCVDAAGLVTGEDPAKCSSHRNIRIGEEVPYTISDWAWNQSYIHVYNIPMLWGKNVRIVNMHEFGKNANVPPTIRAFDDFDLNGFDAYDIEEIEGPYVSAVGTQDPLTKNARFFWWNDQCQKEDGWIYFPNNLGVGERGYTVAKIKGGSECTVDPFYGQALTYWTRYPKLTSTNGKPLEMIASVHFSHPNPGNLYRNETSYFTREYGFSRWESWSANINDLEKYNTGNCNGSKMVEYWGEPFYRYDCRDWTTILPRKLAWHPYKVPLDRDFSTSRNLVKSSDFAGGVRDGWMVAMPDSFTVSPDSVTGNYSAQLDCTKGCSSPALYQDIALKDTVSAYTQVGFLGYVSLQMGMTAVAPPGSKFGLMLHLWGPGSVDYGTYGINVAQPQQDLGPRPVRFRLPWDTRTKPLDRARLEVVPVAGGVMKLDEFFLAVLPAKQGIDPTLSALATDDDSDN